VDYILNTVYRYSVKKWVFACASSYKYNTQNSDDFRYGDTWTNAVTAIYRNDHKNFSLLPSISLTQEHFMRDADKHKLQDHSGGNAILAGAGVDMNTRKVALGLNYQLPLTQELSNGEIDVKQRLSAHLSFVL
jgi:hypothetical protein